MLDAQILVCLSVGLKCWMFCSWKSCANTLYAIPSSVQTSWPPRYLCACLLVGLKGWKYHLLFRNFGCTRTSVSIGWFDVLGGICYHTVCYYHLPFRHVGCTGTCVPIGCVQCWKFCGCWMQRYLRACLSVGLKCWNFCCWKCCANTQYAIPSFRQVCRPGTCVPAYRLV